MNNFSRPKARPTSRANILLPEYWLNGNLHFHNRNDQDRYKSLTTQTINSLQMPIEICVTALNINIAVHTYFRNIGWISGFDLVHYVYYDLVLEFYITFHFQRNA